MLEGLAQHKQVSAGHNYRHIDAKHDSSFLVNLRRLRQALSTGLGLKSVGFALQSPGFMKVSKNLLVDFSPAHRAFRFKNEPVLGSGIDRSLTEREL